MANYILCEKQDIVDIADNLRTKTGKNNKFSLEQIATEINSIEKATAPNISINSSGLITATAGTKTSTYQLAFQPAKTITPSTTSQIAISSGYYTGGNITVAAVPTQSKSVTPSTTSQNVTPDNGKFLSMVTVNAIPSTYVKPSYTKAATTYTPTTTNQTISAGTYLTGVQTIKGDANLVAGNIKSGVSIFGVSGTLEEGGGVDTSLEDGLITRALTSYTNSRVTTIGSYVFNKYSILTSVNFPNVTSISMDAFYYCTSLTSVSFPACTTIGDAAFYNCTKLTSVSFPACTTISDSAFNNCTKLTYVSFPACTTIGNTAFYNCSLKSVNFPACTTIGNTAFKSCSSLTSISFPACTSIGSSVFDYCSSLSTVSLPACTTIGMYAFRSCSRLTYVSFPACTTINSYAFYNCTSLKSIYLLASSICSLANSSVFSNTGIKSTTGSIYVPPSLVASYKTATNWAYFSNRIFGVQGGTSGGSG